MRSSRFSKTDSYSSAILIAALLALILGIYFRLKGLDKSPFTVDEYYLATSIQNILKHGLPQFECGGYYVRGLILQYLAVPFFSYGTNDEFWLRLITVFANLLALPAIYLLGKQVSGKTVGYLVVILFSLSIWETEFARFARMYTPFQTVFIWYLFFLYQRIVLGDLTAMRWMYLLSFASIFLYEGAIFLLLLNFMPLISGTRKISTREMLTALFFFVFAYIYLTYDFRYSGVEYYLPSDLAPISRSSQRLPIELPTLLITSLPVNPAWMILFFSITVLSAFTIWRLFISLNNKLYSDLEIRQILLFSLFIMLALFNLFALIIYLLILALLLRHLHLKQLLYRPVVLSIAMIIATGLFWFSYGLLTDEWFNSLTSGHTSKLKALLVVFLKFPDIFTKIIYRWVSVMPVMMLITIPLLICGAFIAIVKNRDNDQGYLFLFAVSLILVLILAVLDQPYKSTRYTFFLYPIVLLLITVSFRLLVLLITDNLSRMRTVLAALIVAFMILSEDFGIDHLWNINSERILYRMEYDDKLAGHYYLRWDYRAVGEFIRTNLKSDDIIASSARFIQYYLGKLDYLYLDQESSVLRRVLACGGTKDLWTNADILYKPEKFSQLLEDSQHTIWLVLRSYRLSNQIEKDLAEQYKDFHVFRSVDGHLNVFKIPVKQKITAKLLYKAG